MTTTIQHRAIDDKTSVFEHPTGLTAVACIYNTTLGPALSPLGCQSVPMETALAISLKKGRALAYKNALHQTGHGGGCLLVIAQDPKAKSDAFYELVAHVCDHFQGQMVIGQDVGVSMEDMAKIAAMVKDPDTVAYHPGAPNHAHTTAEGVLMGLETALSLHPQATPIERARVLVQGIGKVGTALKQILLAKTPSMFWTTRTKQDGADAANFVDPSEAYGFQGDALIPCVSAAGLITEGVVNQLNVKVIAGSSNLQFSDEAAIHAAHGRGIWHAPDPVINGGGVIAVTQHTPARIQAGLKRIPETLREIFDRSAREDTPPMIICERIARARLGL